MKGRNLLILSIITLAVGVILLLTYNDIKSTGIVICGGILFILAGIINLFALFNRRDDKEPGAKEEREKKVTTSAALFGWITSTAAIVLGVCMLVFQSTFINLVPLIFAILILSCGLFQFYILSWAIRPVKLSGWFYTGGVLLCGCAVYLFTVKAGTDDSIIMLASGISLIVFSLVTLAEGIVVGQLRRISIKDSKLTPGTSKDTDSKKVMDVDAKEIKSIE